MVRQLLTGAGGHFVTGRDACGFTCDTVVVGGCGHVGLPLAIALARRGARVIAHDLSAAGVAAVNRGRLPFSEAAAAGPLARAVASGRLRASTDPAVTGTAEHVIVVIGGDGLGPETISEALGACAGHLRDGQLLVLRSTVAPGTTASLEKLVAGLGRNIDVAFCPERIAQGQAMTELHDLPQIVASRTARGLERASALFGRLTPELVPMAPEEAELAKLITNAWRYLRFAAANQFFMIASEHGLDYERIRIGLLRGYPRAAGLAPAGCPAGPSRLTPTAALTAAGGCALGETATAVNEGLPGYLADRLAARYDLAALTVGILGMAFKGNSDDIRASLSYPLAALLRQRAGRVLCTDPLVTTDPALVPLAEVLQAADLLVIAAPHDEYRTLRPRQPVADIWNVLGRGILT